MSRRKPARTTSLAFGDGPEAIWPQMKGFSSASREMLQVWSLGISKAFHEQQRLSKVNFASLAHTRSLEAYSMAEQSRPTLKHPQEIAWNPNSDQTVAFRPLSGRYVFSAEAVRDNLVLRHIRSIFS